MRVVLPPDGPCMAMTAGAAPMLASPAAAQASAATRQHSSAPRIAGAMLRAAHVRAGSGCGETGLLRASAKQSLERGFTGPADLGRKSLLRQIIQTRHVAFSRQVHCS